MVKIS